MNYDLSLVLPLYNEEEGVDKIVKGIVDCFEKYKFDYQLVLVANGSLDSTPDKIDSWVCRNKRIKKVNVPKNLGYGYGVVKGLEACDGKVIGWNDGDDQVYYEDIVQVYNRMIEKGFDVCKARRMIRSDGVRRKVSSVVYNLVAGSLFWIWVHDMNGKPKFMKREVFSSLDLESKDWFLDTELLVKVKRKGFSIGDQPIVFKKREVGGSNVRLETVFEFLKNLVRMRFIR